jgi:hypothetical protein
MNLRDSVLLLLVPACLCGQEPDGSQVLGLDFPPQKTGEQRALVGEVLTDTTSLSTWVRPDVTVKVYDPAFTRETGVGKAHVLGTGTRQLAVSTVQLDSAGTYYVLKRIAGIGRNDGVRHRYGFYRIVTVRWPVIVAEPDSIYYYGENAFFSFAAGHADPRGYSYEVFRDGEVMLAGDGPVFGIERIWRARLAGLGTFVLRGYYHGRTFLYADSTGINRRESVWQVRVEVPSQREVLTLWHDSTTYGEMDRQGRAPRLDLSHESGFLGPLQFRFAASGPFYEGLYLIPVGITRVDVSAVPAEFLPRDGARGVSWHRERNGLWHIIEVQPAANVLERWSPDNPAVVTLRLRITDEFGLVTSRTYKSRVYSTR